MSEEIFVMSDQVFGIFSLLTAGIRLYFPGKQENRYPSKGGYEMAVNHNNQNQLPRHTCCPCSGHEATDHITRRDFLQDVGTVALAGAAVTGLTWSAVSAAEKDRATPQRRALKVKPILVYSTPKPVHQRSWRSWGGIQTEQDADKEVTRIKSELREIKAKADFPVEFLPVSRIKGRSHVPSVTDLERADAILIYPAGGGMDTFDALAKTGKDVIFFCRHKSGPVYLWYEIISPRYLRQHTDTLAVKGIDDGDVIVDSLEEVTWRLRALCGLRNAQGTRIIAIGGPGAWAQSTEFRKQMFADIKKKWNFDIRTFSYKELGKLIEQAKADSSAVKRARDRAGKYLRTAGTTLETDRKFVDNGFLLEQVFRGIMKEADCTALTINGCMGTIMPIAETSACLTLSLMNDSGYLLFCESDFVVIPSGILLANISGRPVFLNDPTYPHDGLITLAHCTAPRRMDGRKREPARILTHFESDYGAAPKVEMHSGQKITNIVPDFNVERWVGLPGEIVDAPFMDVCRSQIDISFDCDSKTLAERMPGFHWMTCYGDYMKEIGYALKKVGIQWETLTA
jgi:hypothetical protein